MVMAAAGPSPALQPARRRVSVLGATGSVGSSTADLLERNPARYQTVALTGGRNVAGLAALARRLNPEFVAIAEPALYRDLVEALSGTGIETAAGPDAVVEAAARDADWVMAAIVGAAGIASTFAAAERGATVALANKESLIAGGALLTRTVAAAGGVLLPVDSEHSAIFQVLDRRQLRSVEKLVLTASGGPFRTWSRARMERARPEDALAHPNWEMGPKISIDSATMMNKGLELIEAHHLFSIPPERIEVLVHPQSIVHSMVAYRDGSTLAQMGLPDMRTPIAVALAWPDRMETPTGTLDLADVARLDFEAPDERRFPALRLAREALNRGGAAPLALSAANEVAVEAFLETRIGFLEIAETVERTISGLDAAGLLAAPVSIETILDLDREARGMARDVLETGR